MTRARRAGARSAGGRQTDADRSKAVARPGSAAAGASGRRELRIVGGRLRGRKLICSDDLRTRPMKDRVREAVFNLIGDDVTGAWAFDLFAGTGALGIEAISRGCRGAVFLEQHFPTAALVRQSAADLGIAELCEVLAADTLLWARRPRGLPSDCPWLVFCSPPYALYVDRPVEVLGLIAGLLAAAPARSVLVVEADARFDLATLPAPEEWQIRTYPPAVIAIYRKRP